MTNAAAFITRAARLFPLAAFVAAGGCFATRNDVRLVQSDLASMRTEIIKAHAEERDALVQAQRAIQVSIDSAKSISRILASLQGDVRSSLRSVDDQLITLQELLKQSESTIRKLRADQDAREARFQQTTPPPMGATGTDSTGAIIPAQPTTSASVLYRSGMDQLNRNSVATARAAFQELLNNYPTSEFAPQAQLGLGMTYDKEKQYPAAMTAYAAVVAKYQDSPQAPQALYKHAIILTLLGRANEARLLYQQIVTRYPKSDEADLAKDRLKTPA